MHAGRLDRSDRLRRVHALLADGEERSTLEIMTGARVCAVNSCVSELRFNGAVIKCRQVYDRETKQRLFLYRMHRPAPTAPAPDAVPEAMEAAA